MPPTKIPLANAMPLFTPNQTNPNQRLCFQTRNWQPDLNKLIKQTAQTAQSKGFAQNKPKKATGNLTETQRKYKWYDSHDMFKGLMQPQGDALRHPAADDLLDYATKGCPVDCGDDWTYEEIEAAINRGSSRTMDNPEAA